jgi:hypothetical protein
VIGHILSGSPVPDALQWLAAALLFGGAAAALATQRRLQRRVAIAVAASGLVGTVAAWGVAAAQPGVAPYAIRIAAPQSGALVASPVTLTVCGVRGDGSTLRATDAQHYLVVFVDGHEVPTVDAWQFPVELTGGSHEVRVELVTPMHHAFNPPATADVSVNVSQQAAPVAPPSC